MDFLFNFLENSINILKKIGEFDKLTWKNERETDLKWCPLCRVKYTQQRIGTILNFQQILFEFAREIVYKNKWISKKFLAQNFQLKRRFPKVTLRFIK